LSLAVEEFARRREPALALAGAAGRVARTCHDMALRFRSGGTLLVFGNGGAAADAQHVAVEFVHPVIVGKRALPSLSLATDAATLTGVAAGDGFDEVFAHQIRHLACPDDIALGISADGTCANVLRGLETAHLQGLLTIALTGGDGGVIAASPDVDHCLVVPSADPLVVKEVHVTTFHVLWELVHVFLEQPAAAGG
jgi:D-sedoheptulose 7-phosphate isomerase